MNKTYFKALLAFGIAQFALVFSGCEQQPSTPKATNASISDVLYAKEGASNGISLSPAEQQQFDALGQSCGATKNIDACMKAADMLYNKKMYSDAARLYDEICGGLQHIPACLQLAQMFNDGIGVQKNKAVAKEIWEKACYSGDKPSCAKMK